MMRGLLRFWGVKWPFRGGGFCASLFESRRGWRCSVKAFLAVGSLATSVRRGLAGPERGLVQPERPGHIAGMFAPSLVAVGDNDNALVAQVLGILGPPLTRAAPVAGCYEAEPSASFAILLTLKNDHVACPDDLWKIVENMPDSVEVPQPAPPRPSGLRCLNALGSKRTTSKSTFPRSSG